MTDSTPAFQVDAYDSELRKFELLNLLRDIRPGTLDFTYHRTVYAEKRRAHWQWLTADDRKVIEETEQTMAEVFRKQGHQKKGGDRVETHAA
jgi:hypothetical protein